MLHKCAPSELSIICSSLWSSIVFLGGYHHNYHHYYSYIMFPYLNMPMTIFSSQGIDKIVSQFSAHGSLEKKELFQILGNICSPGWKFIFHKECIYFLIPVTSEGHIHMCNSFEDISLSWSCSQLLWTLRCSSTGTILFSSPCTILFSFKDL